MVVLDLSNYASTKWIQDLQDLTAMEAEVDKVGIIKRVNVSSILSNFKAKVDDLHTDQLKIVRVDWWKLSDVMNKELVKKTVYNKLIQK